MSQTIACPKIYTCMQHIWTIFVKNTYTCERIAIEIDIKDAAILVLFQNFKAHHILIFLVNFI